MTGVLPPLARHLMQQPYGDGVAAPTFEVFDFGADEPDEHVARLARGVALVNPGLQSVADALEELS